MTPRSERSIRDLRGELTKALAGRRFSRALELYQQMEKQRPDEPRWSHRKADLLHRMGREAAAVRAYEHAVELYAAKGFDACAVATAKVMLALDPSRADVLERLGPKLRSDSRDRSATLHKRQPSRSP